MAEQAQAPQAQDSEEKRKRRTSGKRNSRHGSAAVRRIVLETAASLFAKRGYGGTSLRDVAEALNMSRTGLYHHFPSKEKLLEAILDEVIFSSERQIEKMIHEVGNDYEAALRKLVETTTIWILDHSVMFRVIDRSVDDLPPDVREKSNRSKRMILESFITVIDRGIEQGQFRPVNSRVAAYTISGMRNWAAWWYKNDDTLTKQEVAEQIADMAVQSLLRIDAYRSRSNRASDVLRVLEEDVAHLKRLMSGQL